MKKTILSVISMLIFMAGMAGAINFKTLEDVGVQQTYSARTSVVSSHTVSGFMLSWSLKAVGGTADFQIKHSTCSGYISSHVSTNISSTIYVLNGETVSDTMSGMVRNPLIWISRIDSPGTTVYVDIGYLKERAPGGF